ncbi:MAG: YaiI/YqxD family protein [Zoogloea sp.]|nr:YaiI/YqxD family protein [Zoogloea sp.]MCA0188352.1 YaiI/YqxD family protein [Pseudomonadota bacterium]
MRIWIDADACPGVIKDILFRAAERLQIETILVANRLLRTPPSPFIRAVQVPAGFDVADAHIVEQVEEGDLVITADIPLASAVLGRKAHALNPRGELYTDANIAERLSMRNFLEELRGAGIQTGGPAAFSQADRQAFGATLDRFLARLPRPAA